MTKEQYIANRRKWRLAGNKLTYITDGLNNNTILSTSKIPEGWYEGWTDMKNYSNCCEAEASRLSDELCGECLSWAEFNY